jgi:hypothetical protein
VAQHPYLWFDSTQLAFMRGKVAANSSARLALKAQCPIFLCSMRCGIRTLRTAASASHAVTPTILRKLRGRFRRDTTAGYYGSLWKKLFSPAQAERAGYHQQVSQGSFQRFAEPCIRCSSDRKETDFFY